MCGGGGGGGGGWWWYGRLAGVWQASRTGRGECYLVSDTREDRVRATPPGLVSDT